jgi:hypothetical protein
MLIHRLVAPAAYNCLEIVSDSFEIGVYGSQLEMRTCESNLGQRNLEVCFRRVCPIEKEAYDKPHYFS